MHINPALPLSFSAMRRFHIERGTGAVIAVFFSPVGPRLPEGTDQKSDQANVQQEAGGMPALATGTNVVCLSAHCRGGSTHG